MNVLLYNDSDGLGGIERHICDLASALNAEGVNPTVVARRSSELERAARSLGVEVLSLPTGRPYTLRASRRIAAWIKAHDVDIVHAHNGRAAMISAIAAHLAGRAYCVKSQHFLEPAHVSRRGPVSAVARAVHRRVNKSIHSWIAVSNAARDRMIQRGEAPPEKIVVIRNGVQDLSRRKLVDPALVRSELGVDVDAPLAVCVGRLEPEKSVTTLIAAWQRVVKDRGDARCVIVGGGSEGARLSAQVREANLEKVVRFVGFRDDAASIMNTADLLVLPSLAESFGLVLLEAMTLSKAVVSTRSGGPEEIVQHGETGLLVPTANPEALADAILRLLNDPALRLRLGRGGRERFRREFSIENMARATAAVYRAVANNEPVPLVPLVQSAVGGSVEVC